jgi:dCMP deaminase
MSERWDRRYLGLAQHVAAWSKDPSTKVGAVIVRPDRTVASVGFNGFPRGVRDLAERLNDREAKYAYIVHGEKNAIIHARERLDGYTLYVWPFMPCADCAGAMIQAGISRVVSIRSYEPRWAQSFAFTEAMFAEAGVELVLYEAGFIEEEGEVA